MNPKDALLSWLRELFAGPHDREYILRRWRIGQRHLGIGLDQIYVQAALARLRQTGGSRQRTAKLLGISTRTLCIMHDPIGRGPLHQTSSAS